MKDLTIIIPTLANEKTLPCLKLCLASLAKTAPGCPVFVASNGSATAPNLKVKSLFHAPSQGQCHAVNLALEYVKTKYVMVSNDDMVYGYGWYSSLIEAVKEYKCVSPNLMEPRPGAAPFLHDALGSAPNEFNLENWLALKYGEDKVEDGFNLPFLTETEIFRTIEGYDEKYDPFGSNSDPDVMYKMMIAGIMPKRVRNVVVYHFSNSSSSPDQSEEAKKSWWHNWRYFPQKWGFERDGRENIWYAAGENGTRIPTKDRPYVSKQAHGHGTHPGQDWIEYKPDWMGKYGPPVYGEGTYYGQ